MEEPSSSTAYEIIRRVDLLEKFPEMGPRVQSKRRDMTNLRQMIVGKYQRLLYEYEPALETVYILVVQHTRQTLPSMRDLRRE